MRELRAQYARRRAHVKAVLEAIPHVSLLEPEGAFSAIFEIEGLRDSTAFAVTLLRETGVALTPGVAFGEGSEGYLRLCFAASEATVTDALDRFRTFMARSA